MKLKKLISKRVFLYSFLTLIILNSCSVDNTKSHNNLELIINTHFMNPNAVYYPSTDYKSSAVVVDDEGNVWYLRMNPLGELKDNVKLFNVNDFNKNKTEYSNTFIINE